MRVTIGGAVSTVLGIGRLFNSPPTEAVKRILRRTCYQAVLYSPSVQKILREQHFLWECVHHLDFDD